MRLDLYQHIKNIPYIKWIARIFILLIVILLIRWLIKKKSYNYAGIKKYKYGKTILNKFIDSFVQNKQKKKQWNKTENMCRKIIENIYNKPFPSVRPDFLKSPMTGKNLELDCYNEELKIALEYNGKQHYSYTPHFHKHKKNFYSQVHRDDWKRKKCRELGIRLIEIPYWIEKIDLKDYIIKELRKKGCY